MKQNRNKHISKYMSLVLRHQPDLIGLALDEQGWAKVDELLPKLQQKFKELDVEMLQEVVANNDKKRFAFNEDQTLIRASQGHSVKVNLALEAIVPPKVLYHGTVDKFIPEIKEKGLLKMSRHHVHLSADKDTATKVGSRRGKPIILTVRAQDMHEAGHKFYKSVNEVWLTNYVAPEYIEF